MSHGTHIIIIKMERYDKLEIGLLLTVKNGYQNNIMNHYKL